MRFQSHDRALRQTPSANLFILRFQQPCSWAKENVEELWEDAVQEPPSGCFIGSLVVVEKWRSRYDVTSKKLAKAARRKIRDKKEGWLLPTSFASASCG